MLKGLVKKELELANCKLDQAKDQLKSLQKYLPNYSDKIEELESSISMIDSAIDSIETIKVDFPDLF